MEQKEEGTKKDRSCKSLSHHHQQRRVQTVRFHERTVREDIVPSEEGTVPCCWGWVAAALVQEITEYGEKVLVLVVSLGVLVPTASLVCLLGMEVVLL